MFDQINLKWINTSMYASMNRDTDTDTDTDTTTIKQREREKKKRTKIQINCLILFTNNYIQQPYTCLHQAQVKSHLAEDLPQTSKSPHWQDRADLYWLGKLCFLMSSILWPEPGARWCYLCHCCLSLHRSPCPLLSNLPQQKETGYSSCFCYPMRYNLPEWVWFWLHAYVCESIFMCTLRQKKTDRQTDKERPRQR